MASGRRYAGKVALVTGGARGIGAGIVRAFVESGAQVVFCDKNESGGRTLEQELPGTIFFCCDVTQEEDMRLALPHLRKTQGNVINISSLVGTIGQSRAVPYVATKGAVTAMTKALALDESQYGVRVNCISPGNIWTPLWEELAASTPQPMATVHEGILAQPLGRMGRPADVAAAAVFLAAEAHFCTGVELLVTGGAELGYGCKASRAVTVEDPGIPS
ncbi:17-beta-hydroxysteroid dehydrogenase 14 isoform X4 [Erinaceus europaeus]|uniref:17-beta-hydroxysteroid dehydrogenase 14 isoform X4 n=1 Tax=Erinaceus europaeus TaxID=9365 RepID=A0ABM3W0G5_ERIEU|nr:17-beta-hydroxysteroid dehydrogenase 14 isoform X4 [Erinaceus europaeus]